MLGPLCYPLLPRMLDKSLKVAGAGISAVWDPRDIGTAAGLDALCPMSASALGDLDCNAATRLYILSKADDLIIPASNLRSLQASAKLTGEWANMTAQQYHVDKPDKTAVFLIGQAARAGKYNEDPATVNGTPIPCTLTRK